MRVEKDLFSTLSKILADPEKDWSNHFPIVQLTEEDFSKGEECIRKHIKSAKSKNESLQSLEKWRKEEKFLVERSRQRWGKYTIHFNPYESFIKFVIAQCTYRKSWEKKHEIREEIETLFELDKVQSLNDFVEPFSEMLTSLANSKIHYENFLKEKNDILDKPDLLSEEKESWFDLNFGGGN
mgnify:FL=1